MNKVTLCFTLYVCPDVAVVCCVAYRQFLLLFCTTCTVSFAFSKVYLRCWYALSIHLYIWIDLTILDTLTINISCCLDNCWFLVQEFKALRCEFIRRYCLVASLKSGEAQNKLLMLWLSNTTQTNDIRFSIFFGHVLRL